MAQSPFPRDTVLLAFSYIPLVENWDNASPPRAKTDENDQDDGGDFPFEGDMVGLNSKKDIPYVPAHFLALICIREMFNILTPMVAMDQRKSLPPLNEEDLALLKQTDTINFTLSLALKFHGTEKRRTMKMLEMLSNIRFLSGLKLCGRIDVADLLEIGKMAFLTSLELHETASLVDEHLLMLEPTQIKKLAIVRCQRVTNRGIAAIPKFAPALQSLELTGLDCLKAHCLDSFVGTNLMKTLTCLKVVIRGMKGNCFLESCVDNVVSKLVNLEELTCRCTTSLSEQGAMKIVRSCSRLRHLELTNLHKTFSRSFLKKIGKYLGETMETLVLSMAPYYEKIEVNNEKAVSGEVESIIAFCFEDQLRSVQLTNSMLFAGFGERSFLEMLRGLLQGETLREVRTQIREHRARMLCGHSMYDNRGEAETEVHRLASGQRLTYGVFKFFALSEEKLKFSDSDNDGN